MSETSRSAGGDSAPARPGPVATTRPRELYRRCEGVYVAELGRALSAGRERPPLDPDEQLIGLETVTLNRT